jgi:CMP-N,N'-diacetyllegionaminic acid synthase
VINGRSCLCVIPARGGSKRIPRKNIKSFYGKPLIQWTIEAGIGSNSIDRLIVSTEDPEIAEISKTCGAEVPFIRPKILAADSSSSYTVLEHACQYLSEQGDSYQYIIMLQPTSPLRTSKHIDEAAKLLEDRQADGVISLTETSHPTQWCNILPSSKEMKGFIDNIGTNFQSQQFEKKFCFNGAIYITSIKRMQEEGTHIYGSSMFAYVMERRDSIDIDNLIDFEIAEFLISKRSKIK